MKAVMPDRRLERRHWENGFSRVIGMDEVGRGPLAGPLTVAAVVLPLRCRLKMVRDSKLMSIQQRQEAARAVKRQALAVSLGWSSHEEIDSLGLTKALRLAGHRALSQIETADAQVLLDGKHNYLGVKYEVTTSVKADRTSLAVAAASVVAKVARDYYMELLSEKHPEYNLLENKGYYTKEHLNALERYGPCPYHRRLFAPVWQVAVDHS